MFANIAAIIVLTALVSTSKGDDVWNGMTGKWSQNASDGFYTIPQTMATASCQGWTRIVGVDLPLGEIGMGYHGDPRVVIFYRISTGRVIGFQVGVPLKELDRQHMPINYRKHSEIRVKIMNGVRYYTVTAYFRQSECGNSRSIWVKKRDGTLTKIPTNTKLLVEQTTYERKECITWMGLHYYKINSETKCDDIPAVFLLANKMDIIGVGVQMIGTASSGPKRTWFETIPLQTEAATIPDAPKCIAEYIKKYGLISFHFWFISDPLSLQCDTTHQD
ncbi:uncharacterized protein LOC124186498 isoform X1 [Neodiprion fabricii]|uniref:uncharacterized protein LOC124186498 isoform X1 n=2 Tax=Neodiprion fabricii TaxID=2872261 RepID=UPI001ED93D16|nr:uncharacterized protein LOC124186498 isoform X1 [Neodiprion fabricii]